MAEDKERKLLHHRIERAKSFDSRDERTEGEGDERTDSA